MKDANFSTNSYEVVRMGFALIRATKGEQDLTDNPVSALAFLLKGKVRITAKNHEPKDIPSEKITIIPSEAPYKIDIIEDSVAVFLYIIGDYKSFCESILLRDAHKDIEPYDGLIHTLPILPDLKSFMEQIVTYCEGQKVQRDISDIKQQELTVLLSSFYSRDQLHYLLSPLYAFGESFYGKVIKMGYQLLSPNDMANELNMSRPTFFRHFKKAFNQSPKNWLLQQKAIKLAVALTTTEESLVNITYHLKFSSQQRMTTFCKAYLGDTPLEIRTGKVQIKHIPNH